MPRKVTPAQLNNMVRQAQRKYVNDVNREIKRVNDHNKRVVDNHNRKVRAHDQRVRENQRRLINELNRLNSRPTTTRYVTYETSVRTLQRSFVRVEQSSIEERW